MESKPFRMSERFVDCALSELQNANRSPIYGFQHLPLLTLEAAVKDIVPLVPELATYLPICKRDCNKNSALLNLDESAAIYLYTMPTTFFSQLNEKLRDKNRDVLKPWFSYLRLFIHALEKLPSKRQIIWRGVRGDVGDGFRQNQVHTWWSVNSCSVAINVIEIYLGDTGTVFAINAIGAKDVTDFSAFEQEQEVILMPGSQVFVQSDRLSFKDSLFIVHLVENYEFHSERTSDENKNSGDRDAPTLHLRGQQSSLSDYNRNAIITPWAIVEPPNKTTLERSIDLRPITQRPYNAREIPKALQYASSKVISANDQFILLCSDNNLHLFDEELRLVRSTNTGIISSDDLVDMVWCETMNEFIILMKKKVYLLSTTIMKLSLIENIRLQRGDDEFTCCTWSSNNMIIGVSIPYDKSCLYHYVLPNIVFITRLSVADLLGLDPPPKDTTSYYSSTTKTIERNSDSRKVLAVRFNRGRLGVLIEFERENFFYSIDLTQHPPRFRSTTLPYKTSRLIPIEKSGEWLIVHDGYQSEIVQIDLDCQLKSECASKEYSKSSFFSFSTGFVDLKGSVNNAIMFGPSTLVLLLQKSLALYKI